MYTAMLKRASLKKDSGARTPTSMHSGGSNYTCEKVKMSNLKLDTSGRNKLGGGKEAPNYSKPKPPSFNGSDVGSGGRVVSTH